MDDLDRKPEKFPNDGFARVPLYPLAQLQLEGHTVAPGDLVARCFECHAECVFFQSIAAGLILRCVEQGVAAKFICKDCNDRFDPLTVQLIEGPQYDGFALLKKKGDA